MTRTDPLHIAVLLFLKVTQLDLTGPVLVPRRDDDLRALAQRRGYG
ncbi:hypothetical protein M9979_11750 [Sphingomonas sp. RP10(2022)]|uniref:Uncharacterized protein n=1 Tax=Sphingomonas liriopis TaxID=2949094 RepID=A0A9X2HZ79_9SPHN|nr:hypothetical protein [Sphingomonas liriopis]MCP3735545.1 hypothetical protein [Sphingomonas liriopis]